jgi:hypothetical protein
MKANIKDRIVLIVTGLCIFIFGIPIYVFLDNRFSEKWTSFMIMSLGYFIALIYLPFTSSRLRKLSKVKIILFQLVMGMSTVGVAALIFKLHILPMPDTTMLYVMAMVILSAATMVFLEYCQRKFKLFNR